MTGYLCFAVLVELVVEVQVLDPKASGRHCAPKASVATSIRLVSIVRLNRQTRMRYLSDLQMHAASTSA